VSAAEESQTSNSESATQLGTDTIAALEPAVLRPPLCSLLTSACMSSRVFAYSDGPVRSVPSPLRPASPALDGHR